MGLFLQIVVFLAIAAALGFALGWLVRGSRLQAGEAAPEVDWQARLAKVADKHDPGQSDPAASPEAEASPRPQAAAGREPPSARIGALEGELAQARQANARHQVEVGRLAARIAELEASSARTAAKPVAARPGTDPAPAARSGTPPEALARPQGEPDDLQQISGIGPGIERTLHRLGIFHFRQIAAFTPENVAWVNQRLRFKGRIEREDWIGQAKRLAAGGPPLQ